MTDIISNELKKNSKVVQKMKAQEWCQKTFSMERKRKRK